VEIDKVLWIADGLQLGLMGEPTLRRCNALTTSPPTGRPLPFTTVSVNEKFCPPKSDGPTPLLVQEKIVKEIGKPKSKTNRAFIQLSLISASN